MTRYFVICYNKVYFHILEVVVNNILVSKTQIFYKLQILKNVAETASFYYFVIYRHFVCILQKSNMTTHVMP